MIQIVRPWLEEYFFWRTCNYYSVTLSTPLVNTYPL